MVDKHVIVTSTPLPTVKDLIEQRHRWGGKVKSYKNGYVVFMGLTVLIVNFLLLFIGLASFHYQEWLTLFGSCFLLKAVVDFIFLYHAADFFSVKINILNFILSEALLPLFYLWLVLRSMSGTYEWKGRKLKS